MWWLCDASLPLGHNHEEYPRQPIQTETELRDVLNRYRTMDPRVYILKSPQGDSLLVGLGGPKAVVKWWSPSHAGADKVARIKTADAELPRCFEMEGISSPFWPPHLLTANDAIAIAVHFFRTHMLADSVEWELDNTSDTMVGGNSP